MAETETRPKRLHPETEMRPRRNVGTSRDRLETETSRPKPQPCWWRHYVYVFFMRLHAASGRRAAMRCGVSTHGNSPIFSVLCYLLSAVHPAAGQPMLASGWAKHMPLLVYTRGPILKKILGKILSLA